MGRVLLQRSPVACEAQVERHRRGADFVHQRQVGKEGRPQVIIKWIGLALVPDGGDGPGEEELVL